MTVRVLGESSTGSVDKQVLIFECNTRTVIFAEHAAIECTLKKRFLIQCRRSSAHQTFGSSRTDGASHQPDAYPGVGG